MKKPSKRVFPEGWYKGMRVARSEKYLRTCKDPDKSREIFGTVVGASTSHDCVSVLWDNRGTASTINISNLVPML